MARIFITGSADGLGQLAAKSLIEHGHKVVLHARNAGRVRDAICGITAMITFHIARHTFATTVTLENGVPIDSVSKMLGHKSIKTTQIYARITGNKIGDDMIALYRKLEI